MMDDLVKEVDNMIKGTAMEVVENKVKVLVDKITKTISSAEGKMLVGEVVFVGCSSICGDSVRPEESTHSCLSSSQSDNISSRRAPRSRLPGSELPLNITAWSSSGWHQVLPHASYCCT